MTKAIIGMLAGAFFVVWFFAVVQIILICLSCSNAEALNSYENPYPSGPTCQEDGITLWCNTGYGYQEVWSYEECAELRGHQLPASLTIATYTNDVTYQPTNQKYRHLWCASVCLLRSWAMMNRVDKETKKVILEVVPYPVQCCDRYCPWR
mgnify:CR=1 FL=1